LESPVNDTTDPDPLSLPPPRANKTATTVAESAEEDEAFDPKFEEAGKLIACVHVLVFIVGED
jgi:hypothetical protein